MDNESAATIETEKARKPRAKKSATVSVLDARGESALVEWTGKDGEARRAYIPAGEIDDGKVAVETLEAGIPYGAPWGELAEEIGLPPDYAPGFARSLYAHGVWTVEDLERNPKAVVGALVEATGITAGALRRAVIAIQQKQEV
jgi:hypothetical protein